MAFPATILDLQADMSIKGTWTSVTGDVFSERAKPTITRGRPDETSASVSASCQFLLDNRTGNYSPHNPLGSYYGSIGRNTPFRLHVPDSTNYARLEDDNVSYFSCPSSVSLNLAGDLEARIDLKLTNMTNTVLCGKWSDTTANGAWVFLLNADGTLAFIYTPDGSTQNVAVSTQPLPNSLTAGRMSLKVTYATASGNVNFKYNTSIGGSYTQLGNAVNIASGTIWTGGTNNLKVGNVTYWATVPGFQSQNVLGGFASAPWLPAAYNGVNGKVYEFQLLNGINGTAVANPVFSSQSNHATSFSDAQGNTWSATGTAEVSSRRFRFYGEMSDFPPRVSDASANDPYQEAQSNGLLRRLGQNTAPIESAMFRAWNRTTGKYAPIAYWPCEDGNVSKQIAAGIPNVPYMNITGNKTSFASNSAFLCSNPIPIPNTASWTGKVPKYTGGWNANVIRFLLNVPAGGDTDQVTVMRVLTGGTVQEIDMKYRSGGALQIKGWDVNGGGLFDSGAIAFGIDGVPCLCELALTGTGGTINWKINVLQVGGAAQAGFSGNVSGSLDAVNQVIVAPQDTTVQSAIGHIAVQANYAQMDSATSADSFIGPLNAWSGESAGLRFARLCTEQGYPYRVIGFPETSVAMGEQSPQDFISLIQECEDADHGMIFEPRHALALGYRCNNSLTSQSAAITLDYTASSQLSPPLEPTDDDLLTTNDVIVTRSNGGSSTEIEETASVYSATGALSSNPPPTGVGTYQNAVSVNVEDDWDLNNQAGWLVHLGTVNELRYPALTVDLARSEVASLRDTIQNVDLGDYLAVTTPPTWIGYDTIKTIVWGITETLGGYIYTIEYQTQPESPFEVLMAGTGAASDNRADTDGSTLHANATSVATSISVDTASGNPNWTTTSGDFPFDIIVSGERMTVTNITGSGLTQTFTVTRSVNGVVKAQTSGTPVYLFSPVYAALI